MKGADNQANDEIDIDEFSHDSIYCPPAQRTVQEILNADSHDESLKRYKESLLHNASQNGVIIIDESNASNVIVKTISLISNNEIKHSGPINGEYTWTIKEGCQYKIQLEFYVQREIVTGLRYLHNVTRLGLPVTKESYMLGSYAPKEETYVYNSPIEEAPSGMLSRGKYRVRSLITDDDKNRWVEWIWNIDIVKDW